MRINSPKYSFVRNARCFDFTNFITENKDSQQYVVINTEISRTLFVLSSGYSHSVSLKNLILFCKLKTVRK